MKAFIGVPFRGFVGLGFLSQSNRQGKILLYKNQPLKLSALTKWLAYTWKRKNKSNIIPYLLIREEYWRDKAEMRCCCRAFNLGSKNNQLYRQNERKYLRLCILEVSLTLPSSKICKTIGFLQDIPKCDPLKRYSAFPDTQMPRLFSSFLLLNKYLFDWAVTKVR